MLSFTILIVGWYFWRTKLGLTCMDVEKKKSVDSEFESFFFYGRSSKLPKSSSPRYAIDVQDTL